MTHIVFEFKDAYSHGKWIRRDCVVSSLEQCIKIYGLGDDCDYKILLVEDR